MTSLAWTEVFAIALAASLLLRAWLSARQVRHVARHRDEVPSAFRASVDLAAHRKAADYTLAKFRLGHVQMIVGAVVLLGWTLFGGLDLLNGFVRDAVAPRFGGLAYEIALVAAFVAIGSVFDIPFEWYSTFRLEQRFGFNRTTWRLWLADTLKGLAVAVAIGVPLLAGVLWIMGTTGAAWWLFAWLAWLAIVLLAQVVVPTFISPLFNRFDELDDETLKARVQALMTRVGFVAKGLFVMDGSRRSAHGNAYFTGFGKARRVVFFDTLLSRLGAGEIEAVLAHELGHFKLHHIRKRMVVMALLSLAFFALLGWLSVRSWFFTGLGVTPNLTLPNDALALLLLMLAMSVFGLFVTPLMSGWSRRDEFEADAFATRHADGQALASALLKLHEDNASTLTPDPVYARFYYSHPPAVERLAALTTHLRGATPMTNFLEQKCQARASAMSESSVHDHLAQMSSWRLAEGAIEKSFSFDGWLETVAFVDALAWMCHVEDHHPELNVQFDRCVVRFSTHSAGGISMNDFICAAKADALVAFVG